MAGYTTGSPELRQASQEMESKNADFQNELRSLGSSVEAITAGWQGSAATAFQNLMIRFNADAEKLNRALLQISEQVTGAAVDYERQEEEAGQGMSSIMNALEG